MKDDDFDFTGIHPLHTFGEFVGDRAREQTPKVEVADPPCGNCPHLSHCSENEVACASFALYVDPALKKNPLIRSLKDFDPHLPTEEAFQIIYKEDD